MDIPFGQPSTLAVAGVVEGSRCSGTAHTSSGRPSSEAHGACPEGLPKQRKGDEGFWVSSMKACLRRTPNPHERQTPTSPSVGS